MAHLHTQQARLQVDGISIFYRHAGDPKAPTILLLHGYPTSSHMFRNLIPLLARHYHVIAPDLPGFGFTTVPESRSYTYTFANLASTISAFVDALSLTRYAIYIFDYGAPTGLRLALNRPEQVAAIVTQNGNAYLEGLGKDFWAPAQKYWASGSAQDREALRGVFTLESTKWQYTNGSPNPDAIPPETYHLDQALMERPGGVDTQLNILYDYRTNLELYPAFQEYFRTSKVPVLAIWGKNDDIFIPAGAEAFRRDVEKFELHWLDTGHFALETNEGVVAERMREFFVKNKVFGS